MKVLHLAAGNLFGGVETYLLTLARLRHLCPGMEPHFGLCFPGRLRDDLLSAGVPVHDLGSARFSRPWAVLRARWRLKRVLREHGFAAVVTHGLWPHAVFGPTAKRNRTRLVNAVHDHLDGRHWIDRRAARTPPDAVVTNSRFTAGPAAAVFPAVPVETVYLPVSPPAVNRDAARAEVRAELGTEPGTVVVLQASRLERWKGHSPHLGALAELKDVPGWEAWFAGGPQKAGEADYLAELERTAEAAGLDGRVKFLGQRRDVPRLMAAADVYCQPNTGPEPFGVAFVEALYAGLPVITSGFGGAVEVVTEACGVLCPPGTVAGPLRVLIADPTWRQSLGAAGPGRAAELCDPARQLAALARVLGGGL